MRAPPAAAPGDAGAPSASAARSASCCSTARTSSSRPVSLGRGPGGHPRADHAQPVGHPFGDPRQRRNGEVGRHAVADTGADRRAARARAAATSPSNRAGSAPFLRVPLDGDAERRRRVLERLEQTVRCPRRPHQPPTQGIDRLVVVAGHAVDVGATQDGGRPRTLGHPDRVAAVDRRRRRVRGVAEHVRQVLVQRATPRNVDHLHAAADAQHRQVVGPSPARTAPPRRRPVPAWAAGCSGRPPARTGTARRPAHRPGPARPGAAACPRSPPAAAAAATEGRRRAPRRRRSCGAAAPPRSSRRPRPLPRCRPRSR